jgi:predicted esterase
MKRTTIALAAGATVAGAALGLRAWMRNPTAAALPAPTPNLSLRVPGFPVLERITGGIDPAQPMPLVLVLHGIGGSEEQLVPYTGIKVPARLVYIRGPVPNGTGPNAGYSYFKARFTTAGFMAEALAMAAKIVRAANTIASQRAVTRTLVLGYSQGGHVAWLLAATGRFDVVLPVSGALAPSYQPPPPTGTTTIRALHGEDDRTLPATAGAATFRAFSATGYKGDFSRVQAGHALTTLGKHIVPHLTASLSSRPARTLGLATQVQGRTR